MRKSVMGSSVLAVIVGLSACQGSPAAGTLSVTKDGGGGGGSTPVGAAWSEVAAPVTAEVMAKPELATPPPALDTEKEKENNKDRPSFSGLRYAHRECAECEERMVSTCLRRIHRDGRKEPLGCGTASPLGTFAVVRRETGSIDDGSWVMDYIFHGPEGVLSTQARVCTEEPDADCEAPGELLRLGEGEWMQHVGNAGDGTNDQEIVNLRTGERFTLPQGDYPLAEHPSGTIAGFFAYMPNFVDDDESSKVMQTLGCFDVDTKTTHLLWTRVADEDEKDPFSRAKAGWRGDMLIVRGDRKKILESAKCPPKPAKP